MDSTSAPQPDHDTRDSFDYADYKPTTRQTFCVGISPISTISAALDDVWDPEQLAKRLVTNVYEKEILGARARYPDEENSSNGVLALPNGMESQNKASAISPRGKDGIRRRLYNEFARPILATATTKATLRRIMLHWGKAEVADKHHIVLNSNVFSEDGKIDSRNSVMWQHSECEGIGLDELHHQVAQLQERSSGLQGSETGLTHRLLERVKSLHERLFVGGSFLNPTAIRYDLHDTSRYGIDRCSMFVNFPYFTLKKAQQRLRCDRGDSRHPTRTLLQSRYRLNDTTERDKSQAIRMLDAGSLRNCIEAPKADSTHLTQKVVGELIYVPQLWALIMGRDHMVTTGPISDQALQGSAIVIREDADRCTLVRISFKNHGMPEEITYPREQCASWFGLLNKHQQIRNALVASLNKDENKPEAKDCLLRIGQHTLNERTWASVLRSADGEILKLWMENPYEAVNDAGSYSDSEKQVSEIDGDSWSEAENTPYPSSSSFTPLNPVPVVKPFLAWPVVDDFGETNKSSEHVRIKRFLNLIYGSLPATCRQTHTVQGTQVATGGNSPRSGRDTKGVICISGSRREDAEDFRYNEPHDESACCIEREMLQESNTLLTYFIPEKYEENFEPIQLFWGAVRELKVRNNLIL